MIKDCAIFISSCDAFADAWAPFFTLFFKYWPDCPYPIYLIANQKKYDDERVETINILEDKHWATNLRFALEARPHPYLIYLQEDYFLKKKVNTEKIALLLDVLKKENAACVRLHPSPNPNLPYKNYIGLGEIGKNQPYRVSLQASLWNAEILKKIIRDGETGWDMEFKGTERSKKISPVFLSVARTPLFKFIKNPALDYYRTGIVKGHWEYGAINFLKKEGIEVNTKKRKIEPRIDYTKRKLRNLPIVGIFFRLLSKITRRFKRITRNA